MVGEIFSSWAVLVVFFGAALAGALAYTALPMIHAPLIGGYPPVYGLIGAFTFLLWTNLAGSGASQYRAFSLIGMLMGIQLLFGVLFGGGWDWVAELAGLLHRVLSVLRGQPRRLGTRAPKDTRAVRDAIATK